MDNMLNDYWYLVPVGAVVVAVFLIFAKNKRGSHAAATTVVQVGQPATQHIDLPEIASVSAGNPNSMSKAQLRRRTAAIAGYVGFNGSGKSATMIWDTLPDLAAGRKVLSTVALLSGELAESESVAEEAWRKLGVPELRPADKPLVLPHPLWIPFTDFRQMITFKHGVILMDEVQGIADSRDSMGLPVQVRNKLFQLRRDDVVLRWSTIDWSASDKRIRNATQVVTQCRGYMAKVEPGKVWPTRRLFWLRSYDARGFDDFTEARNRVNADNRPRPMAHQLVRLYGGLKPAIEAYDSMAQVLSLGASTDAGLCMTCGGGRKRKACDCADHKKSRSKATEGATTESGAEEECLLATAPAAHVEGSAAVVSTAVTGLSHLPQYVPAP